MPFGGSWCIETYSSTTSRSRPRESIRGLLSMHGPETGIIPLLDEIAFKVFQGSCFFLKARLPASSDDDNVFLNAARMRLQRGNEKSKAIERLCAARR